MTVCMKCGQRWARNRQYLWWPIRIKWARWSKPFTRHWVEMGCDALGRPQYSTTLHVGRLKLIFGFTRHYRLPEELACPSCEGVYWQKPAYVR